MVKTDMHVESVLAVDWKDIAPGDLVEVEFADSTTDRGTVDCVAGDGTVIWVLLQRAGHRTMLHYLDETRIYYR